MRYITPIRAGFGDGTLWVELEDGRIISVPLAWFPRLASATDEQRQVVKLSPGGLHWPQLSEVILVETLLSDSDDVRMQTSGKPAQDTDSRSHPRSEYLNPLLDSLHEWQ